ncbi:glycosyltransferase family 4 protein [Actinoplanes sp. N902-109]|uniref:glycosyltransferase family 4 protein n=1 Tax=Actinoplanes sp. (strain N902-109) TaxID=649831 RepID=UPI0003295945|nr:glycosyltransferase family 4 protein [Actinoplanes sp. N902-109]AGL20841.1 glycosyl transferase group 1 [Actinoplanes sp. N902-109]
MNRTDVLVVRPTDGGVAHVSSRIVAEFRRQSRHVTDIALAETAAPAWTGVLAALRSVRRILRARVVHLELGRTTAAPFWFGAVAVTLRRDVVIVAHDAPTLVDAPGAAVMPVKRGWRDAVAHKVFAPILNRPVLTYVRRRAGAVAVLSDMAARRCADTGFGRVGLINHGADAPVPGPLPSQSRTVLFGGFLSPAKGLEDLLEMWRTVGSFTDYQLVIAGSASRQHAEWVARLQRDSAGMANPPRWLGYLDDEAFNDLTASAAIVVLPYRSSNPSSGILVRAMVQGRAIVASRVTAMESLIDDGSTGRLVETGDVEALTMQVDALIRNPQERDRLGAAAAEVAAARHTWQRQAEDLDRVYAVGGRRA